MICLPVCVCMRVLWQIIVRHVEQASDYVVMNCQRCVVFLSGQLGALRLLQLQDCTVVAGPVTGASFMDDLQSCQLYLASYQVSKAPLQYSENTWPRTRHIHTHMHTYILSGYA